MLEELLTECAEWETVLHPDLPYRELDVIWATRYEMARTLEDVLARRTRSLLLNASASIECGPRVAQLMAHELGYDQHWIDQQIKQWNTLSASYLWPEQLTISVSNSD